MLKSSRYTSSNFESTDRLIISKTNESRCRVLKHYIQHWLSVGLGVSPIQYREFLVPCNNAWDIHPVNSADTDNIYTVFAESQRGPMVLLMKNMVCAHFHVHPKYPETVTLVKNFVKFMAEKIYSEKVRMDVPLSVVSVAGYSRPIMKAAPQITHRIVSTGHHTIPFNTARHCGFAFSKRGGPVLVMNNATTVNTVRAGFEATLETDSSEDSSYSYELKRRKSPRRSPSPRASSPSQVSTQSPLKLSELRLRASTPSGGSAQTERLKPHLTWTKEEIREFLHPGYPVHIMPKSISVTDRSLSAVHSERTKPVVKYINSPFPYCRYRHFQSSSMALQSPSQCIKTEPSQSTEKPLFEESKRTNKSKWVSDSDFRRTFRSTARTEVKTPFNLEPMKSKLLHQFRETNRQKWVAGIFKS